VIGEGILAQATGLRPAGLTFVAVVAAVSIVVLVLLGRERARAAGGIRGRASVAQAGFR
jgi:preprotein translocase subunit SecG